MKTKEAWDMARTIMASLDAMATVPVNGIVTYSETAFFAGIKLVSDSPLEGSKEMMDFWVEEYSQEEMDKFSENARRIIEATAETREVLACLRETAFPQALTECIHPAHIYINWFQVGFALALSEPAYGKRLWAIYRASHE